MRLISTGSENRPCAECPLKTVLLEAFKKHQIMMPRRPPVKNLTPRRLNPDFFPTKSRMQNFSRTVRALALTNRHVFAYAHFTHCKKLSRGLFDLIVVARYASAPYVYKNIIPINESIICRSSLFHHWFGKRRFILNDLPTVWAPTPTGTSILRS